MNVDVVILITTVGDEGAYGTFRVPGKKMKGRRPSIKALTPETRAIVERRCELFVRPGAYGPGLDCDKEQALHLHDLRAEAACRLYEATGDARRFMHFLDHRSLDETQKYIDRLVPRAEQENTDIMATFERATRGSSVVSAPPGRITRRATQGATVTQFPSEKIDIIGSVQRARLKP